MSRVVLDTNVIISALLFGGVPEKTLLKVIAGEHSSLSSAYIIEETSRILRTKFAVRPDTLKLLEKFLSSSEIQYFQPFLSIIQDEPDNRIIETAVIGKADYIVTGDKPLLKAGEYQKIKIITPADFMSLKKSS